MQRRNEMVKRTNKDKKKTLHRKLKIKQHKSTKKSVGVNSGAPEGNFDQIHWWPKYKKELN